MPTYGIGLSNNHYIFTLNQVYGSNREIVETRLLVVKNGSETIKDLPNPIYVQPLLWYGNTVLLEYDNKYTCYDGDGNVVQQIVMPMSYMSANDIDKLKQQLLRIDRGLYISDGSIIYWNFTTGQVIGQVKFDDLPSNARLDNFEIIEQSNGTAKIKVNHTLYSGEKAARECSINIETGEISYSNSDGYGIIETPTIQGTELVRKVVAVMDDKPRPEYEIATADFVNGKFSLKLPLTLPSDKLMPMTERFDLPDGVTMTPSTAYGDAVNIDACDANGKQIGVLSMEGATKDDFAVYMYVDRNVQITGSSTSTYDGVDYKNVYDISLVKGWNLLYYKKEFIKGTEGKNDKYVDTQTTNKMSVKWVYYKMDEW